MKLSNLIDFVWRLFPRFTYFSCLLMTLPLVCWADQQPIVVLLSSTEQVGKEANKQLLTGLKRYLPSDQPLQVVRLDEFDHFQSAWRAVLQLAPKLVISPLNKRDVQQLIQASPKVPVIALNQSNSFHAQVWQFVIRAEQPAYQLALHLAEKSMTELLMLSVNTEHGRRLSQSFLSVQDSVIKDHLIYQDREQLLAALYALTGYQKSRRRIESIEKLLQEPITVIPWFRQDVDALVLLTPLTDALEVSHRVDYTQGQSLSLYWVDTGAHSTYDYVRSLPNWGRMKTFMPFYLIEAMQQKRANKDSFFTALGEDAMRLALVRMSNQPAANRLLFKGATGYLSMDDEQRIHARWPLVWLGDSQVEVIEKTHLYDD
jgi:outer membrane PBP1 activator LpoA protein